MKAAMCIIGAVAALGLIVNCSGVGSTAQQTKTPESVNGLKTPAAFAGLRDDVGRAQALFVEAGKVFTHARCVNCHPAGDRPLQTDAMRLHQPAVVRGADGHGVAGMLCSTCHANENSNLVSISVPGHSAWHLAPASMGWEGLSVADICQQLKDPARNGKRSLAQVVEHAMHDPLVGWGWQPGSGRTPVPGSQAVFGQLMQAWVDAGAHCPSEAVASVD